MIVPGRGWFRRLDLHVLLCSASRSCIADQQDGIWKLSLQAQSVLSQLNHHSSEGWEAILRTMVPHLPGVPTDCPTYIYYHPVFVQPADSLLSAVLMHGLLVNKTGNRLQESDQHLGFFCLCTIYTALR